MTEHGCKIIARMAAVDSNAQIIGLSQHPCSGCRGVSFSSEDQPYSYIRRIFFLI